MNKARDVVRSNGAVSAALGVAREYAAEAERAVEVLDPNPGVDALRSLPSALVEGVPL
jgi:geranylgeranyl pyrophosphate synthase